MVWSMSYLRRNSALDRPGSNASKAKSSSSQHVDLRRSSGMVMSYIRAREATRTALDNAYYLSQHVTHSFC